MTAKLFRILQPVSDIDRAARFYSELLGTPGRRISPGRHYFECGATILACFDPRADGDGYDPRPNPEYLYFAVADLESTYDAAKKAGAAFTDTEDLGGPMHEIHTRPWGERSFYVEDPFGNKICFVDETTVFTGR